MWNPDSSPDRTFTPLPLGCVRPLGWLREQLRIQAEGQTGLLEQHWPDLGQNSAWLGGDGEGWERGPYYVDGLVPLAFLLNDSCLVARAERWIDWTLNHQHRSGWFGPATLEDWWPLAIMAKALTQWAEATGDPRVEPFLGRFFEHLEKEAPSRPFQAWAVARWADMALSIQWLHRRTGNSGLLRALAETHRQGLSWTHWFQWFPATAKPARETFRFSHFTHVVNNAMGIKAPAVEWEITGWEFSRAAVWQALLMLDQYHGQATGLFSGDEHLAGPSPTQGTELCAVVEYMFSLEKLLATFGDPLFGDRLEMLAYNALPATFDPWMRAHQYDQQANQVLCDIHPRAWVNNEPDSNLFGLDPNFGCCTANYHQGWPKFVASLCMRSEDDGLALVAHGPCEVRTTVRGAAVSLRVETDYPFRDTVEVRYDGPDGHRFPLWVRIPAWAKGATVAGVDAPEGTFHKVDRQWKPGDVLTIRLPMAPRVLRRPSGGIAVARGPLVFSLRIGERWRVVRGKEPLPDYEVLPTTPWNYALRSDGEAIEAVFEERPLRPPFFSPENAPVAARVEAAQVPRWTLVEGSAGPVPQGDLSHGSEERVELVPYGCAKLRITEFPFYS
ncbi:MAG: glycoside hydrolase family 127 protein [Fimbriimonadales bacterium]|nr:glycoside hydrolase family 127 protein [Fimbriimonadales bacterium]